MHFTAAISAQLFTIASPRKTRAKTKCDKMEIQGRRKKKMRQKRKKPKPKTNARGKWMEDKTKLLVEVGKRAELIRYQGEMRSQVWKIAGWEKRDKVKKQGETGATTTSLCDMTSLQGGVAATRQ